MTQQQEHKTVFISYRRSVASFIARAIFMDLREHGYDVFMDVESIDGGQFDTIILRQIEARAHFLVILTPGTLERCLEPHDWLRHEVEYAIDTQRNIVPLLVNGFTFNDTDMYLTGKLSELPRFNGLEIPHTYFEEAMERLRRRFLNQSIDGVVGHLLASDQAAGQRKIEQITAQSAPSERQLRAEICYINAYRKHNSGDVDGAIADYDEAILLNPQYDEAYNNRGNVRRVIGDIEGAIADYSEAIRLAPKSAELYFNRSIARTLVNDLDGALADRNMGMSLIREYPGNYYSRARSRQKNGDIVDAIVNYRIYLALGGGEESGNRIQIRQLIQDLEEQLKSQR